MREADLSVRLKRPEQHDLVVRRIGTMAFGLYSSRSYLDARPPLDPADGCAGHHLITQLEDIQDATQTGWLTDLAPRARIAIQTSSHEAAVAAALNGGGLACLARFRADREPGLLRLDTSAAIPNAGIWLVVHRDNRHISRIRVVLTHVAGMVGALADELQPDAAAR